MENCKYRLPCGWCDRKNEVCSLSSAKKDISNIDNVTIYYEGSNRLQKVKIFDDNRECDHQWEWQRSTSKGDVLYVCKCCGAIKKKYPYEVAESIEEAKIEVTPINHEHIWECIGISTEGSHYKCKICGETKVK